MDEDSVGVSTLDYLNFTYNKYVCHLVKDGIREDQDLLDDIDRDCDTAVEMEDLRNDSDVTDGNIAEFHDVEFTLESAAKELVGNAIERAMLSVQADLALDLEEDVSQNAECFLWDSTEHAQVEDMYNYYEQDEVYSKQDHFRHVQDGRQEDAYATGNANYIPNDYYPNYEYPYPDRPYENADYFDYTADFTEFIRLSKSCDYIDAIENEDNYDDSLAIRRYSSPGHFHYLTRNRNFSDNAEFMNDVPLDYDEYNSEVYGALGDENVSEMHGGEENELLAPNYHHFPRSEYTEQSDIVLDNEENIEGDFDNYDNCFHGNEYLTSIPQTGETPQDSGQEENVTKEWSDSPKSSPAHNVRNRKKKAKLRKKVEKITVISKSGKTFKQKVRLPSKFADTLEELYREEKLYQEEKEIDDSLTCPVCWEVFYNPYICRPCGHVFCEPCLRKISRNNRAEKRDSPCPICRELIQYCVVDYELGLHVRNHLPEEHNQRRLQDGRGKHMSHPLPSKPNPYSVAGILRRNRRVRQRFTMSPIRLDFWRFLSLVLVFLLFKASLLLVVLFFFNIGNSYFTGEKVHTFGSLFNSVSLKFVNKDQPKTWFWACAFLCACITILFTTRQIYKWIRLKLQS